MTTYDIRAEERPPQPTAVVATTLTVPEIARWLGEAYHAVAGYVARHGVDLAGPPFARFHPVDEDRFDVEAGWAVPAPVGGEGEVRASALPGGMVATTVHVGPYDAMRPAYDALRAWIVARGGEPVGDAWEVYLSDPQEQPDPATWRTEIVQPYRT